MIPAEMLSVILKSDLTEGFSLYKPTVIQPKALWINRISTQTPNEKKKKEEVLILKIYLNVSNSNSCSAT